MKKSVIACVLIALLPMAAWAIEYAIEQTKGTGEKVVVFVTGARSPLPAGACYPIPSALKSISRQHLRATNSVLRELTQAEKDVLALPVRHRYLVDGYWVEKTQQGKDDADAAATAADGVAYTNSIADAETDAKLRALIKAINERLLKCRNKGIANATNITEGEMLIRIDKAIQNGGVLP